jgi:hypothetical protein
MATIQEVAAKTGLTAEQVAEILASTDGIQVTAVTGRTVTPRVVYSPERLAARRAERAAEQTEMEARWRAEVAARRDALADRVYGY